MILPAAIIACAGGLCAQDFGATVGISCVVAIEAKRAEIQNLETRIHETKEKVGPAEQKWDDLIRKQNAEKAALVKERDDIIADLLRGRFCSRCSRSKTQLEKAGISFQAHLVEVKGKPLPVSPERIQAVRDDYAQRIKARTAQIAASLKSKAAEIDGYRKEIRRLADRCEELCQEISQLNTIYHRSVNESARNQHLDWLSVAMGLIARLHIAEDVLRIAQHRLAQIPGWLRTETDRAVAALRQTAEAAKRRQREQIAILLKRRDELVAAHQNRRSVPERALANLVRDLEQAERDLRKKDFAPEVRPLLEARRDDLRRQADQQRAILAAMDREHFVKWKGFNEEIARLNMGWLGIEQQLFRDEMAAVRRLQQAAAEKTAAAKAKVDTADRNLDSAAAAARRAVNEAERKHALLIAVIIEETNRILVATREVSCPVPNETRFTVAGHWNELAPCARRYARTDERYVPRSSAGCVAQWTAYTSVYRPHADGLSRTDLRLVEGNAYYIWSDRVIRGETYP